MPNLKLFCWNVFFVLFTSIANKIWSAYCPNAVVVQCGADCINGDPACAFNLTPQGIGLCIKKILAWNLPTLFLGGGTVKLLNN
jgi:histone deacetylase 8